MDVIVVPGFEEILNREGVEVLTQAESRHVVSRTSMRNRPSECPDTSKKRRSRSARTAGADPRAGSRAQSPPTVGDVRVR
jgi:hypothetical protein